MAKPSDRAVEILTAIADRTGDDGTFWLPGDTHGRSDRSHELDGYVNINGGGDAAILRSLARKGLIERPPGCTMTTEYAYRLTEQGRLAIERARESGLLDRIRAEYARWEAKNSWPTED